MTVGETPPEAVDPLIGKVISERYRILGLLGEGGMGAVYLAEHVLIEKKVALKLLAPELARRPDLAARFLQEAKSASRIGHENVIDISDFGRSSDGFVYIAMEYLDGMDLGATLREVGPMPWPRAQGVVLQICRALRAAHAQGIVHRDMKPENIFLVQREGRPDFVKLLDFGIAKVVGIDNAPRLTRTGMIFGTPEYMAPEQAEGRDADHRVDIYAVGCVIYHLTTGETPFTAESFMAMLTKHLLEDPIAPSARRPDLAISASLDALVMRSLEKDRTKRWQTMQELLDAVEACATEAPTPTERGTVTRGLGGVDLIGRLEKSAPREVPAAAAPLAEEDLGLVKRRPSAVTLVGAGAVVGILLALWWALSRDGRPPAAAPAPESPIASPAAEVPATESPAAPRPTALPPVAPANPLPAIPERPATPTARGAGPKGSPVVGSVRSKARGGLAPEKGPPGSRRRQATPPELKPFPE